MVIPTMMLLAVSDHPRDRLAGAVLLVLTVAAVTVAALLMGSARRGTRRLSLVTSVLWFVGGVLVYPTQRFLADALWASGAPIVASVLTAVVAMWAFSSGDRDGRMPHL